MEDKDTIFLLFIITERNGEIEQPVENSIASIFCKGVASQLARRPRPTYIFCPPTGRL